jgi:hypothetical protein
MDPVVPRRSCSALAGRHQNLEAHTDPIAQLLKFVVRPLQQVTDLITLAPHESDIAEALEATAPAPHPSEFPSSSNSSRAYGSKVASLIILVLALHACAGYLQGFVGTAPHSAVQTCRAPAAASHASYHTHTCSGSAKTLEALRRPTDSIV